MIVKDKESRDALLRRVKNIRADDCPLAVTIEPYKRNRTLEQNKRHWALMTEIATFYPSVNEGVWIHPHALHDAFCAMFLGVDVVELGEKQFATSRGRSSELKVSQFQDLDTQIEAFMADTYGWTSKHG